MEITEEDIEFEWKCWGNTKPWYCPKCNALLATDMYKFCDGTDPELPNEEWVPHEKIIASSPVNFFEFQRIQRRWEAERAVTESEAKENSDT